MSSGKEEFFELVNEGRLGKNIGLSIGSPKLETYMDGFLPGISYLIGAASGTGKSTYYLYSLIYQPLIHFLKGESQERDPYWFIFNLEMTRSQIYAKLVSMYIFDKFGVELRFKKIFSRGKDCILSDEEYNLLKQCSDFMDELDKRILCYEGSLTEAVYVKEVMKLTKLFGEWKDNEYHPKNPQQIVGVVIDHCSLIKASTGKTKKDEMDAISRDSVQFRNICKIISPIHIAQFNRASNSDERLKQAMQDPGQNDFKDSGSLYDDSQVVIALFNPLKYKLKSYKGYNIDKLKQVYVAAFLLKSRFGNSDIAVSYGYYGDCSHFAELPMPDKIYDFDKYTGIDWLLEKSIIEDNIKEKEDDYEKSKLNFVL